MEGGLLQPLWKGRLTPKGSLTTHRLRDSASDIKFPVSKFLGYTHFTFCSFEVGSCCAAQRSFSLCLPNSPDCRLAATPAVGGYSKPSTLQSLLCQPFLSPFLAPLFRMQVTLDLFLSPYNSLHIPEFCVIEPHSIPFGVFFFFPDF